MAISTTSIFVSLTIMFFVSTVMASSYAVILAEDDVEKKYYRNIFYLTLTIFVTMVFATCLTYYTNNPLPTINQARALLPPQMLGTQAQYQQPQAQRPPQPTAPPMQQMTR